MRRLNISRGFTLVELLLALAIFSVVGLAVSVTFGMGVNSWRKIEELSRRDQEARLVLDRIGRELRNCVRMDIKGFNDSDNPQGYDFYGEKEKLYFFTAGEDGVNVVMYRKKTNETYSGSQAVFSLERGSAKFTTAPFKDDVAWEPALDSVKEMEFKYLKKVDNELKWQETWSEEDAASPPLAVWIKIIFYIPGANKDKFEEVRLDKYVDLISSNKI